MLSAPPMDTRSQGDHLRNILIVSSIFHPHIFGGAEIAAYNRARLLARRGHNVSIVTLQEKDDPPAWGEAMPEGYRLYRVHSPRAYTLFQRPRSRGARALWSKLNWHLSDYTDKRNGKLLAAILDEARPDHIDVDNIIGLGFNAFAEIGRRDIPVAYILHDLNLACFNTGMCRDGKMCRRQCAPCRIISNLRQSPLEAVPRLGFMSPSRANLERAREVVPIIKRSPSCVVRNVPEDLPAELPERTSSERTRLLFVGRLDPVKGVDLLLRALDGLSRQFDFHLTVLGTGPMEESLRNQYASKVWVTFRGFVPRREIAASLMENDICCMPSLVAESYGMVTAQALQLGTPVIGSNTGGTAELVRDGVTGTLVPPGDMSAWQDALRRILSTPSLVSEWRENAVQLSHEFDENLIAKAYEDFIGLLAQEAPAKMRLSG